MEKHPKAIDLSGEAALHIHSQYVYLTNKLLNTNDHNGGQNLFVGPELSIYYFIFLHIDNKTMSNPILHNMFSLGLNNREVKWQAHKCLKTKQT